MRRVLDYGAIIGCMREALVAQARGECDTPMPMHLDVTPVRGEVHIKASYRRGGRYFALKVASTFPENLGRGMPTGNGMMLLCSAETGEPVTLLQDEGHLTDVRTAAVAAMTAQALGCGDRTLGILGTGIQARLQARMMALVLPLEAVWIWGRTAERVEECRRELEAALPGVRVGVAESPAQVAGECRLIVTATASRAPLLAPGDVRPKTRIFAVGSDGPGKQELDAEILRRATLILADSAPQCRKLGELQHAPEAWERAMEMGAFCEHPVDAHGTVVCDFTGLGVEDLYIAEYCSERCGL